MCRKSNTVKRYTLYKLIFCPQWRFLKFDDLAAQLVTAFSEKVFVDSARIS